MEKQIAFFKRLVDGAENSNSSALDSMQKAYDALHPLEAAARKANQGQKS
tara:strand:- start:3473 stop:3622 length:150 start_codon:yes stop_codon:yes gene_type:complete